MWVFRRSSAPQIASDRLINLTMGAHVIRAHGLASSRRTDTSMCLSYVHLATRNPMWLYVLLGESLKANASTPAALP